MRCDSPPESVAETPVEVEIIESDTEEEVNPGDQFIDDAVACLSLFFGNICDT